MKRSIKFPNFSKNLWLFPILGGIFALFSLLLPCAHDINEYYSSYFWLCGLVLSDEYSIYEEGLSFIDNQIIQVTSFICTVIILMCGSILILLAYRLKENKEISKKIRRIWLNSTILLISAIIIWAIIAEIAYYISNELNFGFWYEISPGLGIILPFFGAILSFIGYYKLKNRSKIVLKDATTKSKTNYYYTLILLTCIFTVILSFFFLVFPPIIDENLAKITPYYYFAMPEDYIEILRVIGWIFIIIIIGMIMVGYFVNRKEPTIGGAFLIFLPNFSQFNSSMFFLYGIGIFQVIWLPLTGSYLSWLDLGDIVYLPMGYIYSLFNTLDVLIGNYAWVYIEILIYLLLYLGFIIFSLGAATWFYGHFNEKKFIDFSIYKISRHPQYLGFIIWSYAFTFIPRGYALGGYSMNSSLFWVLSVLIIIGIALNEELKMKRKFGVDYLKYQQKTPFLLPLPKKLSSALNFPIKKLIKKKFPENKKEILIILVFIACFIILLSLPFTLLQKSAIDYFR
ncbi:MAG: methyltransferase family protein [Candidatus Hermodarchaeota archaeon]